MKHLPLLPGLFAYLPVCAWALELVPTTIDGDPTSDPGLGLGQPSGVASRRGLRVRETAAAVAIASRNDIERHGAKTCGDAANSLPGVNASAPPGFGGFVSYRGFTSSQITQMFNGINVATGLVRPVDAWIYDRVELVGGPSSLINGAGSVKAAWTRGMSRRCMRITPTPRQCRPTPCSEHSCATGWTPTPR